MRMLVLTAFELTKIASLRLLPSLCDVLSEFVLALPHGVRGSVCAVLFEVITHKCDTSRKTYLAEWFLATRAEAAAGVRG